MLLTVYSCYVCSYNILYIYIDQYMDGEAICQAFATATGPDCIKDVLPRFGERVKVYNAIRTYLELSEVVSYIAVA